MTKTVQELIDRLDDRQYIAIGSGVPNRKKDIPTGSSFYFIGTVKQFKKDIPGINRHFAKGVEGYVPLERRKLTDIRNRHLPGEPPMYAVLNEGTEQGRYALLSEYDKSYKPPKEPIIKDPTGAVNLIHAVAMRAVGDYAVAYEKNDRDGKDGMDALAHFFKSDYGEMITGADGDKVMEVTEHRTIYKMWRDKKKCAKCRKQNCIHFSGEHFTTMDRGELTCPKEQEAKDEGNS